MELEWLRGQAPSGNVGHIDLAMDAETSEEWNNMLLEGSRFYITQPQGVPRNQDPPIFR